jgi:hypothetical protein
MFTNSIVSMDMGVADEDDWDAIAVNARAAAAAAASVRAAAEMHEAQEDKISACSLCHSRATCWASVTASPALESHLTGFKPPSIMETRTPSPIASPILSPVQECAAPDAPGGGTEEEKEAEEEQKGDEGHEMYADGGAPTKRGGKPYNAITVGELLSDDESATGAATNRRTVDGARSLNTGDQPSNNTWLKRLSSKAVELSEKYGAWNKLLHVGVVLAFMFLGAALVWITTGTSSSAAEQNTDSLLMLPSPSPLPSEDSEDDTAQSINAGLEGNAAAPTSLSMPPLMAVVVVSMLGVVLAWRSINIARARLPHLRTQSTLLAAGPSSA